LWLKYHVILTDAELTQESYFPSDPQLLEGILNYSNNFTIQLQQSNIVGLQSRFQLFWKDDPTPLEATQAT
jgi:hypothetical protein